MSNRKPELVAMAPPKKPELTHPGLIPAGTFGAGVHVPAALRREILIHAARVTCPAFATERHAPALGLQGPSGAGKTFSALATLSQAFLDTVLVNSASAFSGSEEGAPIRGLEELAAFVRDRTERTGGVLAVVLDDLDVVISKPPGVETTINQQLFCGAWQHLLDTGGFKAAYGTSVPIYVTGNAFDEVRGPAMRAGRVRF